MKDDYPELADKVHLVANNSQLGVDIISWKTNGKQKQIEVKAIRVNKNDKSFILTINELNKSKLYKNYYVYCVTNVDSVVPEIIWLKNPDFDDEKTFLIEPLTYRVSFK